MKTKEKKIGFSKYKNGLKKYMGGVNYLGLATAVAGELAKPKEGDDQKTKDTKGIVSSASSMAGTFSNASSLKMRKGLKAKC